MEKITQTYYPSVIQSFGMTGMMIAAMLVSAPFNFLEPYVGSEAVMLMYHVFSMGLSLWIIQVIRKKKCKQANK